MTHHPLSILAPLALAAMSLLLVACQSADSRPAELAAVPPPAPIPALVQGVCGDCHGVQAPFISPNPAAPAFNAIANRRGLTERTLASWLIDAHNYPDLMEFELGPEEAQTVADYMVTLQRDDYRPAP